MRRRTPWGATERTAVLPAVVFVLAGAVVGVVLGASVIELVREQLHVNCDMVPPGFEGGGTWICADGIGYIGIAAVLGLMWFLAVVVGVLVALFVRSDRAAGVALIVLAAASVAGILGWTRYGSVARVQDEYAPMTGPEYWDQAIGIPALVAVVGVVLAILSVLVSGPVSWIVGLAAPVTLVAGIVLQPGLGITLAPAAGLLAAAAARGAVRSGWMRARGQVRG